ncbi:MAG: carbohydrate binding family 9 domain-containing protein [Pseudomonadales bacterium]|nr:carbohydrate binding family 9 domain-containing protein [Pseudomonadales bacterium]
MFLSSRCCMAVILLSAAVFGRAQEVVVGHDAEGRSTIRAVRLQGNIDLDGNLDEEVYRTIAPVTDFIQQIPTEGAPASEKTEAWVFFDDDNLYVAARNYESVPESDWVANEMRRDTSQLRTNDSFSVMLDTFLDRRNGVAFLVTPIGGFSDFAISNEGDRGRGVNFDWNIVWDSRVSRFDGGWTVEMQIPFRSLRYEPGEQQIWGVQFRRIIRRLNEASYFTELPISAALGNSLVAGMWRISEAGTLTDLEVPPRNFNIEIKPYALGTVTTNRVTSPPVNNEFDDEVGVDVKFGITNNLTADFTYNTDFAQVEVDERQVNLTRFNLFFPEKREFFLEGRGNFDFTQPRNLDIPTMFFSRRIGLERGQIVPIDVGGRLTGKVGDFDIGALSIGTDGSGLNGIDSTRFSVLRVKRDLFSRSRVGMIVTDRSRSVVGEGSNRLYGIDGQFNFRTDFEVSTFATRTDTEGLQGDDLSYMANFEYNGDRYGLRSGYLVVEENFNPEIGFKRRNNFKQYEGGVRFSPRISSSDSIRRLVLEANTESYWSASLNDLETRRHELSFTTEFEEGDDLNFSVIDQFEMLRTPFQIAPNVTLLPGDYDFTSYEASYGWGTQRRFSGTLLLRSGDFWSGKINAVSFSGGRIEVSPQLSIEPGYSWNRVKLPEGDFRTELALTRVTYTISPRMYFSGLLQYDSSADSLSSNLRFRWEWAPGSELFVVYSDDRDTDPFMNPNSLELRNRGWAIKINRLFQI